MSIRTGDTGGDRWQGFASMLGRRRAAWWLQVPPDPPLLTPKAVQVVLRDVGLLLDYLNRLPETRLDRHFGSAPAPSTPSGAEARPSPPCANQAYFIGRIAAIAAHGEAAKPEDRTEPKDLQPGDPAPGTASAGCDEGRRLGDLAFLIWARDFLAAVAHPATLDTIRVTRAYRAERMMAGVQVKGEGAAGDTADERDLFMSRYGIFIARRVRHFQRLAMFLLWFSLYLSFMVYSGQVLMHENATLRADQAALEARIREAAAQEEALVRAALRTEPVPPGALLGRGFCALRVRPAPDADLRIVRIPAEGDARVTTGSVPVAAPAADPRGSSDQADLFLYLSDRQRALCQDAERLGRREHDLKRIHGAWSFAALPVMGLTTPWLFLGERPRCGAECLDLETHRYGMQQIINGLLAGIMPAVYAALGALASLFRRLAHKAETEQLGPADHGGMMSSLVLGGLTGAVIGLFANVTPQGTQAAGLPLATTALALLAGYATDRVFAMFDNLADRVFVVSEASGTKRS